MRARRYDAELVALRDEIGEARLEDVPALIAQMERLQGVSARRAEAEGALVDPKSPYFGHLELREQLGQGQAWTERDVMIGRATFVDAKAGVRIVDWRHAPVSQLYYRYAEGSQYEESFGDREVEGEMLGAPHGHHRPGDADSRQLAPGHVRARRRTDGGASICARARSPAGKAPRFGRGNRSRASLGVDPGGQQRMDRHLPEIAALIDPRQFELITAPDAGLVVIQGGAGSGKTTIGLHRMAYLAYTNANRFAPQKMRVVTYGRGARRVHRPGAARARRARRRGRDVPAWAEKELRHAIPWLRVDTEDDAPSVVSRMKKHPALLHDLERRAEAHTGRRNSRAVVELWADVLTDLDRLLAILGTGPLAMRPDEIKRAHRRCADRCPAVLDSDPGGFEGDPDEEPPDDAEVRGATASTACEPTTSAPASIPRTTRSSCAPTSSCAGRFAAQASHLDQHLFVDEAQDLSPLELAVLIAQTTPEAVDHARGRHRAAAVPRQRLPRLARRARHLSLSRVEVEPLRIAYRSTKEILAVARYAMGPLADPDPPVAPRSGAPVEEHHFPSRARRSLSWPKPCARCWRASRAPRWRCWRATPSRPTSTTRA